jgi:hypothetical protein
MHGQFGSLAAAVDHVADVRIKAGGAGYAMVPSGYAEVCCRPARGTSTTRREYTRAASVRTRGLVLLLLASQATVGHAD